MEKNLKNEIVEWIKAIAFALVLALAIRGYVFEPMIVPTGSMIHTIEIGDRILVNKFIYRFEPLKRGDIVVFRFPDDPRQTFVKRLIGIGGDVIEIKNGTLYRNNVPVQEPYLKEPMVGSFGPYRVPEGYFFMMGDNRNNSKDSRFWENKFVSRNQIVGKATYRIWPLSRIGPLK
ncbi:MAG: signal peptidase [Thermoanaerobacteraceae bacterium]|jgi:signal peptidase I|uniref:Signal peptidase I n=1 Tax=Biomaibacter acetigenes TaxID=2316383 RepID=A0A3G2R7A4_9FIRM|nr:signal peptidase I [Biomaibacter acetigenes]AYO31316.1 signal peptidase I [Biomaibacter acetigenes]MDK2879172.1 signal peptidase [Thermoanaerobacteraceae bacterium]MDN5311247.1 signal peptidase [Thermoanaerobacteraceae bacterium]RKL61577.1 signal peptidase I [Thermoanaerobacteraceae bacterium SP2]